MCRTTHGIARMSHGSARKSRKDPRNAPVEPGSEKSGDLPGCFKQFQTSGNEQGLSRNSPELQGSTTDLPRRSTDYTGSNRSSPDRRSVAFWRPIRESVTGALATGVLLGTDMTFRRSA